MLKILEHLQRLRHDRVRLAALDVDDEADAAGVVFVPRIVQTRCRGLDSGVGIAALVFRHGHDRGCSRGPGGAVRALLWLNLTQK